MTTRCYLTQALSSFSTKLKHAHKGSYELCYVLGVWIFFREEDGIGAHTHEGWVQIV